MAEDPRHYERYFEIGRWWMSPEELDALRKELGSAEDILERHRQIEKLVKSSENREALWQFMRRVGAAFVALMAAAVTLKALLPEAWWPW